MSRKGDREMNSWLVYLFSSALSLAFAAGCMWFEEPIFGICGSFYVFCALLKLAEKVGWA